MPFIPFIVVFCRVVETSDADNLDNLGSVIEALQLAPLDRLPAAYGKQLRLFKLMYDVAWRIIEARRKTMMTTSASEGAGVGAAEVVSSKLMSPQQVNNIGQGGSTARHDMTGVDGSLLPVETNGGADLMDIEAFMPFLETDGLDLGGWFNQNQQMMRLIEDTDF